MGKHTYLVSVITPDRIGLTRDIAQAVVDLKGYISDMRQTIVSGFFSLVFVTEHEEEVGGALQARLQALLPEGAVLAVMPHPERVRQAEANTASPTEVLPLSFAFDEPVYQLCVYVAPGEESVFTDVCPHVAYARWCDYFCDVIPADGGKPAGIAATLERLGIEPEECTAFGDGGNDVPMFGCVGTSVAMGNASDAVKAAASYVAPDIDEDGILIACEELGLI